MTMTCMTTTYYTLKIPSVPPSMATKWHAAPLTMTYCTRGNFKSISEAVEWAQKNLNHLPYQILQVTYDTLDTPEDVCDALTRERVVTQAYAELAARALIHEANLEENRDRHASGKDCREAAAFFSKIVESR